MANPALTFPPGPWQTLLLQAYQLLDAVAAQGVTLPRWSLGGGTVLMFHYAHRRSKDIDIFVPDPQFLGYLNPRLGGPAENLTNDYTDAATFVKLLLSLGEIDFVAAPPLTQTPFELHAVLGRHILLESPVEIVAKKLWFRGDRATPRDLLDLAQVITHQRAALLAERTIFAKNIQCFVEQCQTRCNIMAPAFAQIDHLTTPPSYDDCLAQVVALRDELLS